MANFVMVHGSWHGGWVWKRVARLLRAAGHDVYTPTLTGMGDRSHLAHGDINLSIHIEDICQTLHYEELEEVILCGHSYGGMVITGVANSMADRLAALVYIDGWLPSDGDSYFSLLPDNGKQIFMEGLVRAEGLGIPPLPTAAFNVSSRDDAALLDRLLTPQTTASVFESIRLTSGQQAVGKRVYICATDWTTGPFLPTYQKICGDSSWTSLAITGCGHDSMLDRPAALSQMLLENTCLL